MATSDYATNFDLDDPSFPERFDDVAAQMLEHCPVVHSQALGGYKVVFRDEDIREVARDWETFSNRFGYEPSRDSDDNTRLYPLEIDPPYQSRWRKVLGPYLGARAVSRHEDHIRRHANDLIDDFIEQGECDFVDAYAAHLPGRVFFSTFLGVPLDDLPYVQQATDDAVRVPRREDQSEEDYFKQRADGWNRVGEYLDEYLRKRQEEPPRDDIVDAILGGVETEEGEPAPWKHKQFVLTDVLAGGMSTTTFLLSGLAHFLATHPEERERLRQDPDLHQQALMELFRYYASILALGRTATKDTEIAGEPVKKGEMVMLSYAVACRDPDKYENPNEINIDREESSHLAFGWGPHRCPGNQVARLQGRITMQELLRRMPDLALKEGAAPVTSHSTITRNWDELPLVFEAGEREDVPIEPEGADR